MEWVAEADRVSASPSPSAEADLARRYARLTSMPGVGPVLAFTLIALLPELGRMITTLNAMLRDGASWQPQAA